jgi:hypothetical protein
VGAAAPKQRLHHPRRAQRDHSRTEFVRGVTQHIQTDIDTGCVQAAPSALAQRDGYDRIEFPMEQMDDRQWVFVRAQWAGELARIGDHDGGRRW